MSTSSHYVIVQRSKTGKENPHTSSFLLLLQLGFSAWRFLKFFIIVSRVFERDGAKVLVDPESLELINGSRVHYSEQLIRSAFAIQENPLAEKGCGCGVSFHLKGTDLKKTF